MKKTPNAGVLCGTRLPVTNGYIFRRQTAFVKLLLQERNPCLNFPVTPQAHESHVMWSEAKNQVCGTRNF